MALSQILKDSLVKQVCCGLPEICDFLKSEIDLIEMCQPAECKDQLKYLYVHLALIEAAQIFARNKVDQQTRNLVHTINEDFNAFSDRLTDSELSATGRSCNWAAATSAQNFFRDSTDDTVTWSERNFLRTAERKEDGYDKSSRVTTGTGFHFSRIIHTLDDKQGERLAPGEGLELARSTRNSSTSGGTDNLLPIFGTKWDAVITVDTSPPFIHWAEPGPAVFPTFPPGSDAICPPQRFDVFGNPLDERICPVPGYPSFGVGYHGRFNVSISVSSPAIGGALKLDLSFDEGRNERQYYHCISSAVRGQSSITSRDAGLSTARTIARPSENRTSSRETTNIYHLVRKFGSSTRRGTETQDAQENQDGNQLGKSHAESNRDSKGQAYQQRRAESLTESHAESHLRRREKLRDDEERRAYGQIPLHLAEMWKAIFRRIQVFERQFAAVPFGGAMNCVTKQSCCVPIRKAYSECRL